MRGPYAGQTEQVAGYLKEIQSSQPLSGLEQGIKPAAGGEFAFVAKLVIIVGMVVLGFWLLDRAL